MTRALLTLDLGNSRLKLRLWRDLEAPRAARSDAPRPECAGALDLECDALDDWQLARFLAEIEHGTPAALCSVADPELEARLVVALAVRGIEACVPDPGLSVETREPERVGRDRLFAARGALFALGVSTIVVDLGTALTVDALLVEDGRGRFLGGAIAPGPALWARAMHAGTARLPDFEPAPDAAALGRTTVEALQAGLAHGLRGALSALVSALAAQTGLERAPIALSGGAARFAAAKDARELAGHPLRREPDIVHLGLWAACAERA